MALIVSTSLALQFSSRLAYRLKPVLNITLYEFS